MVGRCVVYGQGAKDRSASRLRVDGLSGGNSVNMMYSGTHLGIAPPKAESSHRKCQRHCFKGAPFGGACLFACRACNSIPPQIRPLVCARIRTHLHLSAACVCPHVERSDENGWSVATPTVGFLRECGIARVSGNNGNTQ